MMPVDQYFKKNGKNFYPRIIRDEEYRGDICGGSFTNVEEDLMILEIDRKLSETKHIEFIKTVRKEEINTFIEEERILPIMANVHLKMIKDKNPSLFTKLCNMWGCGQWNSNP